MRKRFEAQLSIGSIPISEVRIPTKTRDEFPPFLRAMQYIYCDQELSEKIYSILEEKICKGKKKTGRIGMNLWELFVLAGARLCLNSNYDRLHYLSNYDDLLRQILGVHEPIVGGKKYEYQNIIDNVKLLDDERLKQINEVIVEAGHGMFKKKETEALRLKTDTYVIESNIHFPTDINLLWDSGRKCTDVIGYLIKQEGKVIGGWRKLRTWKRVLKNKMRSLSKICSAGGINKEGKIKIAAKDYLSKAKVFGNKVTDFIEGCPMETETDLLSLIQLSYFLEMLNKHIDLIYRRLIKGEKIPASEKIYSIFETYSEWIMKGKLRPNVELGKKLLVTTDQYHFIVDYQVIENQADVEVIIPLVDRLIAKYRIQSLSADKGFWKKETRELLSLYIPEVIIPKKGKLNNEEKERESQKEYKKLKYKHSAIESNINQLEHNGLNRCPDRGIGGFKRYVGLGVIAYNLHRIGKYLLMKEKESLERNRSKYNKVA